MNDDQKLIKLLIIELESLQIAAQLRANDLLRPEELRQLSQGNADAYAYAILRLRQISRPTDNQGV